MSCEELFLKGLKQKGYRFTPQREMVLEIMHHLDEPSTAEEIFHKVQHVSKSVDISTVYRTLDLLQEFGLIAEIDRGDKEHLYEHVGTETPHLHLVCETCGKIIAVNQDAFLPFATHLHETLGFQVSLHNLTVPGLCEECQKSADFIELPGHETEKETKKNPVTD